ncbi:hypothetical protein CPB83DRAFT_851059 [Crepidotus variabilis]|uniref:Uncharacterized protein n=1 Tax=Crepidotus variabilis TaxID=179855 RepID=A0A9P6EJA7_9AGAR|nr:hypothetical protein CPB83DRAFT_851059 [Crepidotus variabilis]
MAASRLRYVILILQRIIERIRQRGGGFARALILFLRRILVWWGRARSQPKTEGITSETKGYPPRIDDSKVSGSTPSPSSNGSYDSPNSLGDGGLQLGGIQPYILIEKGDSVSLNGAAMSLNPYTSARKGAGSAQSLQAQRSSHNLSVISHNASRSSQQLGSEFSHPISAKSEDYVFQVQRSPTQASSPYGPRRQFSISEPQIGSPTRRPIELPTEPIHIPSAPSTERLSDTGGPRSIEITRSQSPAPQFLDNFRITPVMPESTSRYDRRGTVPMKDYPIRISPLKFDFTKPYPPSGWKRFIHPEGARYFYHPEKRVYTEADLFNSSIFAQITADITEIEAHVRITGTKLPDRCVMFIDTVHTEDDDFKGYKSSYYFVDHISRSIFFLDEFDANSMSAFYEIWGCKNDIHLGHEIEAQYWYFIQLYPDALIITSEVIAELRDVILHFIGDSMSSAYSISPHNLDDLNKILGLTNSLEKNIGKKCIGAVSFFGRFMYLYAHARFQNFHGEGCARLERDVSVHGILNNKRTWLVKILSPILFSAPDVHLKLLRKMYVDGIMKHSVWETSVRKMNEEWQEFILFATVLLNANVAFLAIQSVDTNDPTYSRSPAQIASYLSVIASIGSIILGLLLIRQHRTKYKETASDVTRFLARREHKSRGLETLAILHSLPYALLMWGMVSFLVAFCLVCVDNSSTTTRILITSACVAMAILVAWCVWSAWESQPENTEPPPPEEPVDEKVPLSENGGNSKPTTIADETGAQHQRKNSGAARMLWRWMPDLKILDRFRKGSLDSQRTVV